MHRFHLTPFQKDLAERVLWTVIQAVVGVLVVAAASLPPAWIPVVAAAAAFIKGQAAKHIGAHATASTVDAYDEAPVRR